LAEDLPPLVDSGARVVASIWGRSVDEFAAAARELAAAPAAVVAVEVNVSCPNLEDGRRMFSHSPEQTAAAVAAAAACGRPLWAKLSPNAGDIVAVAGAALDAGAEALTLVNTLAGMAIDLDRRAPALGGGGGGLSGAAIHAVAVRAVFDCRAAFPTAAIVGSGGVGSGKDAVELLLAGACAVQVGTATLADPRAPMHVLAGLGRWCDKQGVRSVKELVGGAHRRDSADAYS